MKRNTIYRAVPVVTLAAMAAAPAANALAATHTTTTAKSVTYKGPTVDMQWGTVQVSVVIKKLKITDIKPRVYVHTERSVFINEQALPMLKQEVMQAQSAKIDLIGGATFTSVAYVQSLQSAVKKAKKAKALK